MIWPTVLPGILTAWKVNLGNAARVVVVAELVGATGGVGYELLQQQQLFDMAGAMAWTLQLVFFVLVVQGDHDADRDTVLALSRGVGARDVSDAVTPDDAAIRLDHVSQDVRRAAARTARRSRRCDDLSFDDRPRRAASRMLGKTGCGKSTIFNMIAGLIEPSGGAVARAAATIPSRDFDWFRGKIGIVFQNDRLMPWRTAIDNVALGLEMLEVPAAERRDDRARLARRGSALPATRTIIRTRCRAACASASRSRAPSPTNAEYPAVRRAVLGARRDRPPGGCARNSSRLVRRTARPRCSSPTRSARRWRSATASWC